MSKPDDVMLLNKIGHIKLEYLGLETNFNRLYEEGWNIKEDKGYSSANDWINSDKSNDYLYLRHPVHKLMMRVKKTIDRNAANPNDVMYKYSVDFLTHEKNHKVKPPKYVSERNYTEDDIQPMLDTIMAIQAKRPRKRKTLPQADVLSFIQRTA